MITGIVILHYKDIDLTIDCLKSVLDSKLQSGINIKVYLVDNGSSDDFNLKESWPVEVIRNQKNLGYAQGNNVGIKKAIADGCEYIWILNNDTVVDKNCLSSLVETLKNDPKIGIVGPKIYFYKGYEFHKDRYSPKELGRVLWWAGGSIDWNNVMSIHRGVDEVDAGKYDLGSSSETITGAAMLVRADVFKKAGLLDSRFYLYFEESDLCERVKKIGYSLYYQPKAIIWHKNAGSSGSGSELHDYYLTRNRLFFGLKYAPWRTKQALIRESLRMLFSGRKWQKRGVIDFYSFNLGKGSYSRL